MGGLAFHALCPDWKAPVERERRDIDLATRGRDGGSLAALMSAEGYVPDQHYNTLYGHKQLYFVDPERNRPVDILIDRLEMCHRFDFGDRLSICDVTLPPADLLLTKLQIVTINRKDMLDVLALLAEYPLSGDDAACSAISLRRITDLTSSDWGWWRTTTGNLDQLNAFVSQELRPNDLDFRRPAQFDPAAQLVELRTAIDAAPKSMRWRLRAQVGDRIAWYEQPEEIPHGQP
ncbi:MAG TPA: hypothetical protein VGB34_06460 [Candidatus Limnocylindria bacterium]|jgi:hypothetical protein